jgi:hypothetical protein
MSLKLSINALPDILFMGYRGVEMLPGGLDIPLTGSIMGITMAGYNTTVTRNGVDFHLQTQDKGRPANYVESTVYKSGRVLSSKKTFYTSLLDHTDLQEKIKQVIKEQHATLLKEIADGKFDHL